MSRLTDFFSKDDNYRNAKRKIKKVKESFDGFVIAFPDVTSDEIMFIKDKWETLPNKIARGVKIMALKFNGNFKTLLTEYKANAYIMPHKHLVEYEIGTIVKGSVSNNLTGVVYNEGDTYRFSPNEVHYLYSKDGCLVHSALASEIDYDLKPLHKKTIKRLISA